MNESHISAFLSLPSRLIFGTLYPAYYSYKAVKSKDIKEYVSSTLGSELGVNWWEEVGALCCGHWQQAEESLHRSPRETHVVWPRDPLPSTLPV